VRRLRSIVVALALAAAPASAAGTSDAPAAASTSACREGATLERLDRWDAAATAYAAGLQVRAQAACAERGLRRLQAGGRLCAAATALEDAGLDTEAQAAYAKVLELQPSSRCASVAIADMTAEGTVAWLREAIADLGQFALAAAIAVLAAALLAWMLLCVLTHAPGLRRLPGVRHLRRVRLQLKSLGDGASDRLGSATTGLLRSRLVHDANDKRVALASGPSDTGALDGLADVSDQARVIVALLRLMRAGLPKRDWVVIGVLQGASADGLGLSIALDNNGRFTAFGEFWANTHCGPPTKDVAETYRRLTIPAAGWLGHQVAAVNDPRALLSSSADSWALFTVGLHWCDRGERRVAGDFYERARNVDPHNIAALANLGVMAAEDGRPDDAERMLSRALELLER